MRGFNSVKKMKTCGGRPITVCSLVSYILIAVRLGRRYNFLLKPYRKEIEAAWLPAPQVIVPSWAGSLVITVISRRDLNWRNRPLRSQRQNNLISRRFRWQ